MLEDGRAWDDTPVCEASDDVAIGALVSGAHKTGITALLELIPPPPPGATICPRCAGTHVCVLSFSKNSILCVTCLGRGWATPEMIAEGERRWPSR